jgi:hypothetical protein
MTKTITVHCGDKLTATIRFDLTKGGAWCWRVEWAAGRIEYCSGLPEAMVLIAQTL